MPPPTSIKSQLPGLPSGPEPFVPSAAQKILGCQGQGSTWALNEKPNPRANSKCRCHLDQCDTYGCICIDALMTARPAERASATIHNMAAISCGWADPCQRLWEALHCVRLARRWCWHPFQNQQQEAHSKSQGAEVMQGVHAAQKR